MLEWLYQNGKGLHNMAFIVIKGLRKRHHEEVSQYLYNLQKELKINRLRSKSIYLTFKRSCADDALGYCSGDKRVVEIEISKQYSFTDQMLALAHEMVHAKQFLRKELVDGYMYKGRNYWECRYDYQPWEKSAYALETKLYKKCWSKNMHVSAKKHCTFI